MNPEAEFWELFAEWGVGGDGTPLPCTVEPCLGSGPSGRKFGPPVSHPGLPRTDQQRLVRNADGTERSSQTALYAPLSLQADFPLGSRVSLGSGALVSVEGMAVSDAAGLFSFLRLDLV